MKEFSRFVICDTEIKEAKIVPERCLSTPGHNPPGLYDTLLISHSSETGTHIPTDWPLHWRRFTQACHQRLHATPPANTETLLRNLLSTQPIPKEQQLRCRLSFYENSIPLLQPTATVRFLVQLNPVAPPAAANPFVCQVAATRRTQGDPAYNYKRLALDYVDHELATARQSRHHDVLFLNDHNEICEASYSNFWIIKDNTLVTPPIQAPCLPGIIRQKILQWAHHAAIPVHQRPIPLREAAAAHTIFLTSSIRGIQIVNTIPGIYQQPHPPGLPPYWSQMASAALHVSAATG